MNNAIIIGNSKYDANRHGAFRGVPAWRFFPEDIR